MRLKRYLNEKYLSSVNFGEIYDIFKNPSKKEIKELADVGYGFRIIMDLEEENIYFASGDIMHRHMLQSPELKNDLGYFSWDLYWQRGSGAEQIVMFDVDNRMTNMNSDSLYNLLVIGDHDMRALNSDRIDELLDFDYKWLKKYDLNPIEVKGYIKTLRRRFGK